MIRQRRTVACPDESEGLKWQSAGEFREELHLTRLDSSRLWRATRIQNDNEKPANSESGMLFARAPIWMKTISSPLVGEVRLIGLATESEIKVRGSSPPPITLILTFSHPREKGLS